MYFRSASLGVPILICIGVLQMAGAQPSDIAAAPRFKHRRSGQQSGAQETWNDPGPCGLTRVRGLIVWNITAFPVPVPLKWS